jgi:hypothetical protein
MGQVNFAQTLHAEQVGELISGNGKNQGTLKADGKEYSVILFADSESVSESASEFLQDASLQKGGPQILKEFKFVPIDLEIEMEILELLGELSTPEDAQDKLQEHIPRSKTEGGHTSEKMAQTPQDKKLDPGKKADSHAYTQSKKSEVVYTSLFSLARSFNMNLSQSRPSQKSDPHSPSQKAHGKEESRSLNTSSPQSAERTAPQESRFERREKEGGKQGRDDQEEGSSKKDQRGQQEEKKEKSQKVTAIASLQAARKEERQRANTVPRIHAAQGTPPPGGSASQTLGSVENIYFRFMALMARILGQAEYEAHQLYLRIKERTDNIDVLTLLISKVNSEKGAIDWSNNEEMKQLVERARAIGVDIPQGKYTWSEEEKKLLKENIQMRKDSMEKMTQLERTDMQRFLQEASQCHQARSNVLKLLKEVVDTIIANMRP